MKSHCYSSFGFIALLTLALLSIVAGQTPKNIVYRNPSNTAATTSPRMENIALRENLNWTFGGKSQRGWYLYEPLITHFLEHEGSVDSGDFAAAVARWQHRVKISTTGLLDEETWMRLVEHWQARRSKDRTIPAAENLVLVSGAEFYDPERLAELRQVERATYAAYQRMVAVAAKELNLATDANGKLVEPYLKIISAFRSPEYQQKLRAQSPNAGRAGLAINSPHFTGRALDLYVGGDPVSTKDANRTLQTNTKIYRWLVKNAGKFGFIPYFYEPWHWEYNPSAAKP